MPADPSEAGRKGGRSRSLKKLLAAKRNGFQKKESTLETPNQIQPQEPTPTPERKDA